MEGLVDFFDIFFEFRIYENLGVIKEKLYIYIINNFVGERR